MGELSGHWLRPEPIVSAMRSLSRSLHEPLLMQMAAMALSFLWVGLRPLSRQALDAQGAPLAVSPAFLPLVVQAG